MINLDRQTDRQASEHSQRDIDAQPTKPTNRQTQHTTRAKAILASPAPAYITLRLTRFYITQSEDIHHLKGSHISYKLGLQRPTKTQCKHPYSYYSAETFFSVRLSLKMGLVFLMSKVASVLGLFFSMWVKRSKCLC